MMQNDVEESLRLMTLGEIAMAKRVFGHSIVYSRVWIHCDSYFPFGLQKRDYAMAPNGEIWFRKEMYYRDFSGTDASVEDKHTFIHELGMYGRTSMGNGSECEDYLAGLRTIITGSIKRS